MARKGERDFSASQQGGYGIQCSRANLMASIKVESIDRSMSIEALTQNVSHQGMGFYSPKYLPQGKEVLINVYCLPNSELNWVETVTGTVKWCKRIGGWYGAGVEFKDMNAEQQSLLFAYIESALQFYHSRPH